MSTHSKEHGLRVQGGAGRRSGQCGRDEPGECAHRQRRRNPHRLHCAAGVLLDRESVLVDAVLTEDVTDIFGSTPSLCAGRSLGRFGATISSERPTIETSLSPGFRYTTRGMLRVEERMAEVAFDNLTRRQSTFTRRDMPAAVWLRSSSAGSYGALTNSIRLRLVLEATGPKK